MKMNKIYHYLWLLIFLMSGSQIAAQEAEFIQLKKDYILHNDGSQEFRCYKELKILTHTAMRSAYGETFIVYNPEFQKLKIHSCYTVQKDGTKIEAPANAFVEVLPRFAADAPAYNQLKEMVVVHTGLDIGSTIFLDYSILTQPGYYPALDIDEFIQETSPIREFQLSITVPKAVKLNYLLTASTVRATEKTDNDQTSFSWVFKNRPASSRESFLPENGETIPRLTANTYESSTKGIEWVASKINKSSALESETFAQFLTENASSTKDKFSIIHQYVVKNISFIPIPMTYTGYSLRNADETLRSAYGTELEKANLLNVMLNAVGIDSKIIFFYPGTVQVVGGLSTIKRIGLNVSLVRENQFFSANSIEAIHPEYRADADQVRTLSGKVLEIASKPAIYHCTKEVSVLADKAQNGYLVYSLPEGDGIDRWPIATLNSQRNSLFEIPAAVEEEIIYLVSVPKNLQLVSSSNPSLLENEVGKVSQTIENEGDKLKITRAIELKKQQYTVSEYNLLRNLMNEWNSNKHNQLVFKVSN